MAYRFECSERNCEFLVQSRSTEEIERLARSHVRMVHNGRIDSADLERKTERIEPA